MNGGDDVKVLFFLDLDEEPIPLDRFEEYHVLETRVQVIFNGPWKVTEFHHLVEVV